MGRIADEFGLRSPVIQNKNQTKSDAVIVACVPHPHRPHPHLFERGPDVYTFPVFLVLVTELEVVEATVLDGVGYQLGAHHEVLQAHALPPTHSEN